MMTEQETLHEMAKNCAYNRFKRRCKHKFGGPSCGTCKLYIANYSQASLRDLKLYMYGAECSAQALIDLEHYYSPVRNAVTDVKYTIIALFKFIVYCAIFGAIGYGLYYLWRHR